MQNASADAPHWLVNIVLLILGGGGWLVALYKEIINRKKPGADIHLSEAQAEKEKAEARNLDVNSSTTAANTILNMINQLRTYQEELRETNNKLTVSEFKREEAEKRVEELERILKNSGNGKVR